jgi:hypothetical protein
MTSSVVEPLLRSAISTMRLLVTSRDPQTRRYRPVGFLTSESGRYTFAYLQRERQRPEFRPLPGLARAASGAVSSSSLFPLFAERVISSRRPDREVSFDALGLPPDAAPMEVLARSHGQRVGDTVELLHAPEVAAGEDVSFTFLTHGVRYLRDDERARIERLSPGEVLRLRAETDNEVNPRALLVTDLDDVRLGWLPEPLIDVVESIENRRITVERANGPHVGFHFRLLARLDGRVTRDLFTGPGWETT